MLRKKSGGFTSFRRAEFCIAQRRTSNQRSHTTGIESLDLGEIEYQHAQTIELFNPAAKSIERGSAHHASRAAHHGYILQTFDFVLEFHTLNLRTLDHTNLPWEKFPV